MSYVVVGVICLVIFYVAWESVKEAKAIKDENAKALEEEYRQNRFAIEQYNRNKPARLHVKTIEQLRKKLEKNDSTRKQRKVGSSRKSNRKADRTNSKARNIKQHTKSNKSSKL